MKGKIVGSRYQVLGHIASGGFGRTYLAEDTQLPGRDRCVVKQLFPNEDLRILAVARRLFETEASTLNDLGHHDQIPELLAYFEEAEKFYLVQQYISGQTLEQELQEHRIWSEAQVIVLLKDVLGILEFIHSQGVIHRDLKPDNLIRRHADRQIVLVDFGTVKKVFSESRNRNPAEQFAQSKSSEQLTVAVGTKGYMPVEQARGNPQPSSDLYALGAIAIQLVTGTVPIELAEDDQGDLIWESLADVTPQFAQILTKMTRYQVKDRYRSATEILQILDTLGESKINQHQNQPVAAPDKENQSGLASEPHSETAEFTTPEATVITANNAGDRHTEHDSLRDNFDNPDNLTHPDDSTSGASFSVAPDELAKISSGNRHDAGNVATVIDVGKLSKSSESRELQSSLKTPRQQKNLGWAIAAFTVCLIAASISGLYFLTYRPNSGQQQPVNNDPSSPNPSTNTPRRDQGEGFRKGL